VIFMDENEQNFDFEGNESWALLALFAMAASMSNPEPPSDIPPCGVPLSESVSIDEFTLEQLKAAARSKTETDMYMDQYNKALEDEAGYTGLTMNGEDT